MSLRTRLFAVTATLLIICSVGAASATAATPSCGASCIDLSTPAFGSISNPTWVLADQTRSQNVGQPLTLASASNANPGEDFDLDFEGTVDEFVQAGLMWPGMDVLYASLDVYEIEYSPFGAPTGLCVGVPPTPANGTRVALEPCGVSAKTTWIPDTTSSLTASAVQWISGATSNSFFDPYVLSALAPGLPLSTSTLRINSVPELAPDQLWGAKLGVL